MSCRAPVPRLHVVTNDEVVARRDFVSQAAALLKSGGERLALHLRAPRASGREVFGLAARLSPAARDSGSPLIVNDRVDVALAAGAAGVQTGARGLEPCDVRRMVGPTPLLGVSVHGLPEGERAAQAGADFVLAGSLFPTASHPRRAPAGIGWLGALAALGPDVIGIGGIDLPKVVAVRAAGARGVAVIRAIWNAERPREAALRFIDALY